jgi:tripartite-type tricarboxylate transporter receptor subunit TctC
MKLLCHLTFCSIVALGLSGPAHSQPYPSRPIRLIAPYEPGGGVDIMARLVARQLGQALNQTVAVENRPGAGGVVGTQALVSAPPDGYTLILDSTSPIAVAPFLVKNLSYDPQKDLVPVALVANSPAILLVQPASPIHSVADLIALAKAQPGKLTFSSSGIGGTAHLAAQLLKVMAGVDMLHVPYKGTAPATSALLAGDVTMSFTDVVAGLRYVQSGQLRGVAVTSAQRLAMVPKLPTVGETVPGYVAGVWYGIFAPARTPAPIIATLHAALAKGMHTADTMQTLGAQGVVLASGTPEDFARFIREETARWGKVMRASGITPE